jgi:hypothetical protein
MEGGDARRVFRKEGEAFAPRFSFAGKPGNQAQGQNKKFKGGDLKNVNEVSEERFYID